MRQKMEAQKEIEILNQIKVNLYNHTEHIEVLNYVKYLEIMMSPIL
jgi:hypothetical protein